MPDLSYRKQPKSWELRVEVKLIGLDASKPHGFASHTPSRAGNSFDSVTVWGFPGRRFCHTPFVKPGTTLVT
jgi:hypothetical protein